MIISDLIYIYIYALHPSLAKLKISFKKIDFKYHMIFIQWSCMSSNSNYISSYAKFKIILSSIMHFKKNTQYKANFIKLEVKSQTSLCIIWSCSWPNCQIQLIHNNSSIKSIHNIIIHYILLLVWYSAVQLIKRVKTFHVHK